MGIGVGISGPRGGKGGGSLTATLGIYSDSGHTTPVTSGDYGDIIYLQVTGTGLTGATWYVNGCEAGTGTDYAYTIEWIGELDIEVVATNGSAYGVATDTFDVSTLLADTLVQINELSTYTLNGADVSVAENFGSGVDATQTLASRQPLYVASGINSLPSVDYSNGLADNLFAAGAITADCTVTMVFELSTIDDCGIFWVGATYNDGSTYFIGATIYSGEFIFWERAIGRNYTTLSPVVGQKYIVQVRQDITRYDVRINGETYWSGASADAGDRSVGMFIGNGFGINALGEIEIGHTTLVNRALSDQELNAQEQNLKEVWGISY